MISEKQLQKTSIFISMILRHKPEVIGITLDEHGWANVSELIDGINRSGKYAIDMDLLEEIVRTDRKQRYSFNEDHTLIRANRSLCISHRIQRRQRWLAAAMAGRSSMRSTAGRCMRMDTTSIFPPIMYG